MPRVRRGTTSSLSARGAKANPGPRPLPLSSASRGVPGGRGRVRPCANLRQTPHFPESAAAPGRDEPSGHPQTGTRPAPGRGVTGTTPGPAPTPRLGQVPGLLTDTHPQPLLPVRRCRRLALAPVASSHGGPAPASLLRPTPPLGARCAGPGSGERRSSRRRRRPLSSLLLQCVPPTETRLVFPGSGLGESLASEPPASGFASSAVARQAQRWRRRGTADGDLARFPPQPREGGDPQERRSMRVT